MNDTHDDSVLAQSAALMVPRNCARKDPALRDVPGFQVSGDVVMYVSPESTFNATKRFIDQAKKSVLIGIYDFSAAHVKELLYNAMGRGVRVSLMLDVDSEAERNLFTELAKNGVTTVVAPSCSHESQKYFASCHEKVIVVDDRWVLVQSGNYSSNSCPFNEKDGGDPDNFAPGNRDMGIAFDSKPLASFFSSVLKYDIQLSSGGSAAEAIVEPAPPVALAAPSQVPTTRFPSRTLALGNKVKVRPVLSPDNYMKVVVPWLEAAEKSILIEQQYIRRQQNPQRLLEAMRTAKTRNPNLDVRIILARAIGGAKEQAKLEAEIQAIGTYGFRLKSNVRLLSPKFFVHCHNKLVIVDDEEVLVSSQNWSDAALTQNREAGVIVSDRRVAQYYRKAFQFDWDTGLTTTGKPAPVHSRAAMGQGQAMVLVAPGDIADI